MTDHRRSIRLAALILAIAVGGTGVEGVSSVSAPLDRNLPQSTDSPPVHWSHPSRSYNRALDPPRDDPDDAYQQLRQRLTTSISVDFRDRPLRQVIADLRRQARIPIILDRPTLEKDGIDLNQPISISLEGVSLKAALSVLLHQLRLGYLVQKDGLLITTERQARGDLVQHTYLVADLLDAIAEAGTAAHINNPGVMARQSLRSLLMTVVDPSSWVEAGGPGTVEYSAAGTELIVIQTGDQQDQVEELLQALRSHGSGDGAAEFFEMLAEEPVPQSDSRTSSPGSASLAVLASVLCLATEVWPFPVREPPLVWTALANNPDLPLQIRRDCVLHLFRRHVQPGMKVSDLAYLLDHPTWLRRCEVCNWNQACGSFWIPVEITKEDTTFGIRIFPELDRSMGAVYLRVSGKRRANGSSECCGERSTNVDRMRSFDR